MRKQLFCVAFITAALAYFFTSPKVFSQQTAVQQSIVSVHIGGILQRYTLFGYTSAKAVVKLEGIGVSQQTKAQNNGYFEFVNFLAPITSREFCLISIDTENLMSPPLCIPIPENVSTRRYGPFLLPPTIRLSYGNPNIGQESLISGKTIPGTSVQINSFSDNPSYQLLAKLMPVAYAQSQKTKQNISTTARSDGTFTTKVVSQQPGKVRVFAQSKYLGQKTPKSTTLTINILGAGLFLLMLTISLLKALININTIILLQLVVLAFLLYRRLKWAHIQQRRQKAIVLYRQKTIVKKNYSSLLEFDFDSFSHT